MSISKVPWRSVLWIFQVVRHRLFTRDRDDTQDLIVNEDLEEVIIALKNDGFVPWDKFAYNYKSEDSNLIKGYVPSPETPLQEWYQIHVRAFEMTTHEGPSPVLVSGEEWVELECHTEKYAPKHPEDHLQGTGTEVEPGLEAVKQILEKNNIRATYSLS